MPKIYNYDVMFDDTSIDVSREVGLVWSIANSLRGAYTSDKYKDVIIPMVMNTSGKRRNARPADRLQSSTVCAAVIGTSKKRPGCRQSICASALSSASCRSTAAVSPSPRRCGRNGDHAGDRAESVRR